jgi:hypothetical protein
MKLFEIGVFQRLLKIIQAAEFHWSRRRPVGSENVMYFWKQKGCPLRHTKPNADRIVIKYQCTSKTAEMRHDFYKNYCLLKPQHVLFAVVLNKSYK